MKQDNISRIIAVLKRDGVPAELLVPIEKWNLEQNCPWLNQVGVAFTELTGAIDLELYEKGKLVAPVFAPTSFKIGQPYQLTRGQRAVLRQTFNDVVGEVCEVVQFKTNLNGELVWIQLGLAPAFRVVDGARRKRQLRTAWIYDVALFIEQSRAAEPATVVKVKESNAASAKMSARKAEFDSILQSLDLS